MGDHHQVKTSFLFIQLQSPSKTRKLPRPASTASSASSTAPVEGPSITSVEDPTPTQPRNTDSSCLDALRTKVHTANSKGVIAGTPSSSLDALKAEVHTADIRSVIVSTPSSPLDSLRTEVLTAASGGVIDGTFSSSVCLVGDVAVDAGDSQHQESLCLNVDKLLPVTDDIKSPSESPVWILRQDNPAIMSGENPSSSVGSASPPVYPKPPSGARVSFLHPAGQDAVNKSLGIKFGELPKPNSSPQAPAQSTPITNRPSNTSWVHSAKQKEVSSKGPVLSGSAERATFLSAVIERSSKLSGDTYRTALNRSPSKSTPATPSYVNTSPPQDCGVTSAATTAQPAVTMASQSSVITTAPLAGGKPATAAKAETFVWVNNSSHAQSVAKAKYEFLFGKAEETSSSDSASTFHSQILPEEGSSTSFDPPLQDDDIDETSLFLEIDRELANLLSGLAARSQDAAVASNLEDRSSEASEGTSAMIPCSGQNGTPLDVANRGPEHQVGCSGIGQLEKPGESLLASSFLLDTWPATLLQDPLSLCSAAEELHDFSAGLDQDVENAAPASQDQPEAQSPAPAAPLASRAECAALPASVAAGRSGAEVGTEALAVHSGSLLDESLEESSKILAEIPGIFTAFLDGGQPREKPPKKLRFMESRAEANGDVVGETPQRAAQSSSLKVDRSREALDAMERSLLSVGEDEVFKAAVPELCVQSPQSEATEHSSARSAKVKGSEREEATDVFSSQFERILESERLRNTLYSSLDSLDALSSADEAEPCFTFDMPLTPMIQQRLKESSHFLDATSDLGRQEVLSVTATGKSGKAALEVTSSFLDMANGDPAGTGQLERGSERHAAGPLANGVLESVDRDPKDWLHGCLSSDAGLKDVLSDWDSDMGSTERLKDSTDTLHNGNRGDQEAARRLARRLYHLEGFRRSDVAKHLGKNNDFSKMVAEEYLTFFEFTGMTLDQSLRSFLKAFALMGETQERERVLIHYSNRYYQCNPTIIASQDGVHCLTCALMLLNTDLHGHNIGKKMTCQEFINNLDGLNGGQDFPRELLKGSYKVIEILKELEFGISNQVLEYLDKWAKSE